MSIATAAAQLLKEAGVGADAILAEAGQSPAEAIRTLAGQLGVNLNDVVDTRPEGAIEVQDAEVQQVRDGLAVLTRIFQ